MLSRVSQLLSSLLHNPLSLCAGLGIFLISMLFLIQNWVYVDAEGRPLQSGNPDLGKKPPITAELLELAREHGWKNDPQTVTRVIELSEAENDEALQLTKRKPLPTDVD